MKNPVRSDDGVVQWDCVWFGNYPQSDASGMQKEPIKWRVLQVDGNDAFLLADQCLDAQPFHHTGTEDVTWETCSLRAWLNKEFWAKAFSAEEQEAIIKTTLKTNGTYYWSDDDGIRTTERVFVLSIDEVIKSAYGFSVYAFDEARMATHTAYSGFAPDATMDYELSWWWLRTSKYKGEEISGSLVDDTGCARINCMSADVDGFKVRPALHLDLSSSAWSDAGVLCVSVNKSMEANKARNSWIFDIARKLRGDAAEKLDDQEKLIYIAKHEDSPYIRTEAVKKLSDQKTLAFAALNDDSLNVRTEAVKKLEDQRTLNIIARSEDETTIRKIALMKIEDQKTLIHIALHDYSSIMRYLPVTKMDDVRTLIDIASNDSSYAVRGAAKKRLNELETLE